MQVRLHNYSLALTFLGLPSSPDIVLPSDERTYWPFRNQGQWELAHHVLFPAPFMQSKLKKAISKSSTWINPECGFENIADFNRRLGLLPAKGGEWKSVILNPQNNAPRNASMNLTFWYRDSLEILRDMVGDKRLSPHIHWAPQKITNSKKDRVYSELWSGDWWWNMQVSPKCLQNHRVNCQEQLDRAFDDDKSRTIVPIVVTSDKTLYSGSGKATGWPLYMTIGNISDFVRFVPGQHCAQLLALFPVIKGTLLHGI